MKIAVLRGRNAKECHLEPTEALGNRALPYRTVARWADSFQRERVASADGLYRSYKRIQVLIRQLCIKSYEKICICVRLLQSRCHMHLLNNKNGVAVKLVVFIWKDIKMEERTC